MRRCPNPSTQHNGGSGYEVFCACDEHAAKLPYKWRPFTPGPDWPELNQCQVMIARSTSDELYERISGLDSDDCESIAHEAIAALADAEEEIAMLRGENK